MKKLYEVQIICDESTEDKKREIVEKIYNILNKSEGEGNDG